MDRIHKFLLKLTKPQRQLMAKLFENIYTLSLKTHDIKSLKGYEGVFRLKKGKVRILFIKKDGKGIVVNVGFRKDIYKK